MADHYPHIAQYGKYALTRPSTLRAQTSLAEADHYSHIAISLDQPGL